MSAEEKPKRVLSEDALAKLAVAREKALQVRRQQHADKLKAQVAKIEEQTTTVQEPAPEEPLEEKPPEPKKKRVSKRVNTTLEVTSSPAQVSVVPEA